MKNRKVVKSQETYYFQTMETFKKTVYDPVNDDDDDILYENPEKTHLISIVKGKVFDSAVCVSSTHLGQFAIKQIDNLLWSAEKTAKWSCGPEEMGECDYILSLI